MSCDAEWVVHSPERNFTEEKNLFAYWYRIDNENGAEIRYEYFESEK
jgi:hypothetical protein